ncbi:NAD(P)/FAD-dependent oxidoreductase [Catellatospora coxensis]
MSGVSERSTHVVVIGGGFAGVACARTLTGQPDIRVTLLDRNGYHQFQPLLYQVATAELDPADVSYDLEQMFAEHDNVQVRTADVVAIDPQTHTVSLADGDTVTGDVLVLAAGAQANFFDVPGAAQHTFPLYTLDDALKLRERLRAVYTEAAAEGPAGAGEITFVVVGGGPTGVETAGALAELVGTILPRQFEKLALIRSRIVLVDHGHAVLGPFGPEAQAYAAQQLQRRGVRLRLGVTATEVGADHVILDDGTTMPTRAVIWGGGVSAAPLVGESRMPTGRGGRIDVRPDLTVDGHPGVYAAGDAANIPGPDGLPLPQLASVAQQAGRAVGFNIIAEANGRPRSAFAYHDKGIMAMIGRGAALAELGARHHELHGRIAFAAWLGIHAYLMADAKAETNAFITWAEEFYLHPGHCPERLLTPPVTASAARSAS